MPARLLRWQVFLTEVNVKVHQTAGVGDQVQIPGTDADSVREHMNRFAKAVQQNPTAFKAELPTYRAIAFTRNIEMLAAWDATMRLAGVPSVSIMQILLG